MISRAFRFRPAGYVLQSVCLHPYSTSQKCWFITLQLCRINQFSNLRVTIDDFTAYPQVSVFTTTCGSLSESKPEPHHTIWHINLSLDDNISEIVTAEPRVTCRGNDLFLMTCALRIGHGKTQVVARYCIVCSYTVCEQQISSTRLDRGQWSKKNVLIHWHCSRVQATGQCVYTRIVA